VVTRIYRLTRADGREVFTAAWYTGGQRQTRQFQDYPTAYAEATLKAEQLAAGRVEGAEMSRGDRDELQAMRKLADKVPPVAAMEEWRKARDLTGGHLIAAAEAWKARNASRFKRIKVAEAIDAFIKAKERAGKQGERTYRAKLSPLNRSFPDQYLDTISGPALTAYLEQFQDGVTRNDLRKRAVALWRWAQKSNYLPREVALEIEQTERADEQETEIGILNAEAFGRILGFIRANHPQHLASVVLAGFCGIRADEIHGKRKDRSIRQTWEDIHLEEKFVRVTVAKKNTPAWRFVPLCDSAIEWLLLCSPRSGEVCEAGAMEKVRLILRDAGFNIPENCFRHSFISYRVAVTGGNKPQVATEAGNSVAEIDRRYRRPVTQTEGEAWFAVRPGALAGVFAMHGKEIAHA
jgi:hypothetical protein